MLKENNKRSEIKMKMVRFGITVLLPMLVFWACSTPDQKMPLKQPAPQTVDRSGESANSFFYFTQSQFYQKKGDVDKAIESLKMAIEADPEAMYLKRELAQLYWQRKEDEAANAIVTDLMLKNPDNIENLILYARIKHGLNELDEAKSAYEKVIAKDPAQKAICMLLGGLYMDEGNPDFAIQVYQKMIKQFPNDFAGYYLVAQGYALKENPAEAERNFRRALEMEPGLDEARYELIDLYKKFPSGKAGKRENRKKILGLYQEMLTKNPENVRAAMELGIFYFQIGRQPEAERIFEALGERSKTDRRVFQHVVQFYMDQKKYDDALVILKNMLTSSPAGSEIHYLLGIAYDGKDDYEAAINHFKQIQPTSRFFQNAVVHIAFLYQETGKTAEAITYLGKMIDIQPRNIELRLYLGTLFEEAQQFEQAEAVLKEGIGLEPKNPKLLFRLGVVYDKWGKRSDSISIMKEVIQVDPRDANALNYLGYTYADMGENLDEAERLVIEALKYKPDDGYIIDSLGWVYYRKGDYEKSVRFLKKAVELVSDDPTILEHLGDVYRKTGKQKEALEMYRRSRLNATEGKENLDKKIKELIDLGY